MARYTEKVDIPLGSGVNTKFDERVMDSPALAVCKDAEFEEIGGLQTRKPFVAITNDAGNTLTNIRRLAVYGDELIAFTAEAIWSYSSQEGLWIQRSEYYAVKVDEDSFFVRTGEQFDCDRVEKGGVTMFSWSETTPSGTLSYVAAVDTATGAVKMSPTSIKAGATRPRLLTTTNKIYLVYAVMATPALWYRVYDPADLSSTSETSQNMSALEAFDAITDPNTPTRILTVASRGTQYTISRYNETPAQSSASNKARTANDAISLASDADNGDRICVVRFNGTTVRADILNDSFTDQTTDTAIATPGSQLDQITCAYADNVCHIFMSSDESSTPSNSWYSQFGSVNNSGVAGSTDTLVAKLGLASRAFEHNGNVFAWMTFGGVSDGLITAQLQNTYFLYKVDGTLVGKAVPHRGGGLSTTIGFLPQVQDLGSNQFAFATIQRNIIPLGQGQKGYSAKSLREVTFEFDSNEARRTAQLGKTLYITGAQVSQFDGENCVETGFHLFPWSISATGTAGSLTGEYNWQQTYAWFNAKGEFERSTTATIYAQSLTSHQGNIIGQNLHVTSKNDSTGNVISEFWRGTADAAVGEPFYLVTDKDPSNGSGDNCFVLNDINTSPMTTFVDDLTDANLISKETFPEAGGAVLENIAPPQATIIHATQDRIILAGIAGHPYKVAYSKLRGDGEIAAFHEALSFEVPPSGGKITALGFLNETLIVFCERAIWAAPGDGYDNTGGGVNFGPARILANDVGATSADTVTLTPKGIVFLSSKGWYLLNRGWNAGYIGGPVEDFNSDTFHSAFTVESQHQVRICSTSRILCWDYLIDEWSEWSPNDCVHSVMWNSAQHYASSGGSGDDVMAQEANWDNNINRNGLDIETAWIKLDGLQGYQRIREIAILGEYRSACRVRVRVAYNYDDSSWTDDTHWTVTPTDVGGPMQMVHNPSVQKCQSVKIRVTARDASLSLAPLGEAFKLSGIQLEYALKRNRNKRLPAGQKQ